MSDHYFPIGQLTQMVTTHYSNHQDCQDCADYQREQETMWAAKKERLTKTGRELAMWIITDEQFTTAECSECGERFRNE